MKQRLERFDWLLLDLLLSVYELNPLEDILVGVNIGTAAIGLRYIYLLNDNIIRN